MHGILSASLSTHEKGVLREVNAIILAINSLFGAASDSWCLVLAGNLIATLNACAKFFSCSQGFRLLLHLSHRRQVLFGCFAAELRTLGIVFNQRVDQRKRVSRPTSTLGCPNLVDLKHSTVFLANPTCNACC